MSSKLIAVISPAKLLDDSSRYPELSATQPLFQDEAKALIQKLKKLSSKEVSELMDLSPALGQLNKDRFNEWHLPFDQSNSIPSVLMFKGDVYRGLKAEELGKKQLEWAQDHLRILSGLYGILKPLDLIQPYRLMMGTPFSPSSKHKNLYSYWGNQLAESLKQEVDSKGVVVNLASQEYFKAVPLQALDRRVVTCEFKERKGGKVSIVSTYAKLARGMMARYIIDNKITKPDDLKGFDSERYLFEPGLSTENEYVFVRG